MTHWLVPILARALLIGVSLSSFLLALILIRLLDRFAKDVNEVVATWRYIEVCIVMGAIALIGVGLSRREQSFEA